MGYLNAVAILHPVRNRQVHPNDQPDVGHVERGADCGSPMQGVSDASVGLMHSTWSFTEDRHSRHGIHLLPGVPHHLHDHHHDHTVSTPDNQYSTTGVTDGPNGNDPSFNSRVVDLSGQIVIPVHYAQLRKEGPESSVSARSSERSCETSPDAECSPFVVFTACADFSDVVAIPNVMSASASG